MDDLISRQDAIKAIISLCDDCDSDYCGSCRVGYPGEINVRKALEDLPSAEPEPTHEQVMEYCRKRCLSLVCNELLENLPSAQPEPCEDIRCEYCHEDSDGYVKPIEKNCHAFVRFGMDGWELSLKANGWHGSAKIRFCPMCGRRLKNDKR